MTIRPMMIAIAKNSVVLSAFFVSSPMDFRRVSLGDA